MAKIKIQIKTRFTGSVLFEYEKENNTIKDTVVEAVKNGANLGGADLRGADLRSANLGSAYLRSAYLYGADLRNADLGGAYLYDAGLGGADLINAGLGCADLRNADLRNADLCGANLCCANLCGANLYGANLRNADLGGAYLYGAGLRNANLYGAENIPYVSLACPSDGSFIGWKKVHGKLVKLEIPEDAKRSSATTSKCRCGKAKVLSITDIDGSNPINEIENTVQNHHVTYKVGEMVFPDSFDENRWNECSHGIHFFINKQDAIDY